MAVSGRIHLWVLLREQNKEKAMSKRKVKFPNQTTRRPFGASGVTLSESLFRPHPRYPSHFSPLHKQTLYTVNVSESMLHFIERMATDPSFRNQVDRIL